MRGWFAALAVIAAFVASCYDLPKPACGFVCGPALACPEDYSCNVADNRCHLAGSSPSLVCATIDASVDTTIDLVAPMVVQTIPATGASGFVINANIDVFFSEQVGGVSSATFRVRETVLGTNVPGSVNPSGAMATFDASASLTPNTSYTVTLDGFITDFSGNQLAPYSWSFMTGSDNVPPIAIVLEPFPGSTGLPVAPTIAATFDEDVFNVNGSTFGLVVDLSGTPVPATVMYDSFMRTGSLVPSVQLAANTGYRATLGVGITDNFGNPLSGSPLMWTFMTGQDFVAPRVTLRSPAPSTTGISVDAVITATFDENVVNVSAASFTVAGGSAITGMITYSSASRLATFTPDLQLVGNTVYTVTLTNAIADGAGNPLLNAPIIWTFTTGADTSPPQVALTTPLDMATGVATSATITVRFDEPVANVTAGSFLVANGGSIGGTLASTMNDTVWTFTPSAALPATSLITVTLTTAITDAATNALGAPVMFSFTTN